MCIINISINCLLYKNNRIDAILRNNDNVRNNITTFNTTVNIAIVLTKLNCQLNLSKYKIVISINNNNNNNNNNIINNPSVIIYCNILTHS